MSAGVTALVVVVVVVLVIVVVVVVVVPMVVAVMMVVVVVPVESMAVAVEVKTLPLAGGTCLNGTWRGCPPCASARSRPSYASLPRLAPAYCLTIGGVASVGVTASVPVVLEVAVKMEMEVEEAVPLAGRTCFNGTWLG